MLQPSTLKFISALKKNNNKPWFDEHRKEYDAAKKDFESFTQTIIDAQAKIDPTIASLHAKDCIFRINRDVRFSKDKSPYKTNFGASINAGGRKSMRAGYYMHLEPGQSFAGGGLYMPMPPELKKVRQEIDYNWDEFNGIISSKKFKSVFGDLWDDASMKITRVPQGFDKESPAAEFLMFKSYVAAKPISDDELTGNKLLKTVLDAFSTLQPMLIFLNRSFD